MPGGDGVKKRILALCLCGAALALSGCAAMLERSHVSSTAHVDYAMEEDDESILRAETYQGLVNSMRYFIDGHRSGGVIRLYNYTGDVASDLAAARDEVLQDPVGAFAVGALSYESTRILTYYEVTLSISYSRTAREVEEIPEVLGLSGVRQELNRLVSERHRSAVFMASYFSGDMGLVDNLLLQGIYNAPELYCYPDGPEKDLDYTISLYPETGARRIVEIEVNWQDSEQQAVRRAEELEMAASALLEASPPAGERYTVEELAGVVRAAHGGMDAAGTQLPLEVLTGAPSREEGLLLAMEYLCRQCGIEAVAAWGDGMRDSWLIVSTPEGYRHLLAESLYAMGDPPPPEDGEEPADGEMPEPTPVFRLYTDQELTALGYEWPESLYPVCVDSGSAETPEPDA